MVEIINYVNLDLNCLQNRTFSIMEFSVRKDIKNSQSLAKNCILEYHVCFDNVLCVSYNGGD